MQKRIEWIDICKGIAILLVIIGHSGLTTGFAFDVKKLIYSFHMPLFFIISGYLFKKSTTKEFKLLDFIYKKIKSLVIPYFSFNIIFLALDICKSIITGESIKLLNEILGIFVPIRNNVYVGVAWFLIWIFVTEILYYFLVFVLKKDSTVNIVSVLLYFIGFILIKHNIVLPYHIDAALISIVFYNFGNQLKKYELKFINVKCIYFYIFIFIIFFLINNFVIKQLYGSNVTLDIYERNLSYPIIYLLVSISGSLIIILISKIIKFSTLKKIFKLFGYNSLCIYGFHTLINYIIMPILKIMNITSGNVAIEIIRSTIIVLCCFGLLPLCKLIEKNIPFMFGYKGVKNER